MVLVRDVWKYHVLWAGLVLQWGAIIRVWRHPLGPPHGGGRQRAPSDSTWFVPVHLWGIASVMHAGWALAGGAMTRCWGPSALGLAEHAAFSGALLPGVLALCFLAEHVARRLRLPARPAQATVPLPVVAAILGVAACWQLAFLMFLPIIP